MLFLGILTSLTLLSCGQEVAKTNHPEAIVIQTIDSLAIQDSITVSVLEVVIQPNNVVDRMVERPQLSQFVAALSNTTLDSILKTEEGPFTVFAVLNSQEIRAVTAKSDFGEISGWVASYIVKGAHSTPNIYKSFSSLRSKTSFKTYNVKEIAIYELNDTLFFESNSNEKKAWFYSSDLHASNGIVHIIKYLED